MATAFAGYPAPFIFDAPAGAKIQQLIWGDFVTLLGENDGEFTKVRSRRETGWMRRTELQDEQLLEVNFVDIGQGDGAFIVTPDDHFMMVDAGESDNMLRFLSWRFNLRTHPERVITIPQAVISHSDQDHYKGFAALFASPQFHFGTVFHNGIVERAGSNLLGPRESHDGRQYLMDVITDSGVLRGFLAHAENVGTKQYPKMLKSALDAGKVDEFRGASAVDRFLPGHEDGQPVRIEVLAPVPETIGTRACLRWFGSDGETKNGHSVVLRFVYRNVRIVLGGDLNVKSEEYLLGHYTGLDPRPTTAAARDELITRARRTFECDVAKACHHGSADFTDLYLCAVNAIATVISSGDDEPYAHPRPDALGALGKCSRGDRPLLFSTELARSSKENIRDPQKLREEITRLFTALAHAATDAERSAIQKKIDDTLAQLERSVAVYGMINLRTDGRRVLLAQKLERPRSSSHEEWDVHLLEPGADGALHYVSRH